MATRVIESDEIEWSRSDAPLMSCSARLPVYADDHRLRAAHDLAGRLARLQGVVLLR